MLPAMQMSAAGSFLLGASLLVGCAGKEQGTYVGRPSNPIYASESFGALEAVLEEPVPVRSVMAAAEAALRDRGYTITLRRTTDEAGRIEAKAPSRELGRKWVVETRATGGGGTSLSVKPGGWDNEAGAEVLMDAILALLGR